MKRSKTSFGYEKYKVTDLKTDRVISTKSIKSARTIASDFEEYFKIYNRKKV